jgi:hypothetical protein
MTKHLRTGAGCAMGIRACCLFARFESLQGQRAALHPVRRPRSNGPMWQLRYPDRYEREFQAVAQAWHRSEAIREPPQAVAAMARA